VFPIKGHNGIAVNMVDADDPKYFKLGIFKQLVKLIAEKLENDEEVHLICNVGKSRSASVAMLYLAATGHIKRDSFKIAKENFKLLYPHYSPGRGISQFLDNSWHIFFPTKRLK
jgi:hypothetical protein